MRQSLTGIPIVRPLVPDEALGAVPVIRDLAGATDELHRAGDAEPVVRIGRFVPKMEGT